MKKIKDFPKQIYYYSLHILTKLAENIIYGLNIALLFSVAYLRKFGRFLKKHIPELILILLIIVIVLIYSLRIKELKQNEQNLIDAFRSGQFDEYQRQIQAYEKVY